MKKTFWKKCTVRGTAAALALALTFSLGAPLALAAQPEEPETAAAAQLLRAAENMVGQLLPNAGTVRRPQEMPAHAVQVRHNQLIW